MNTEDIKKKIEEAKEIVGNTPNDPFTQIAFKEVLRVLLQGSLPDLSAVQLKSSVKQDLLNMQISEFLAQKKIKTEPDRIDAILYYNLHKGQEAITRAEILDAYNSARTPKPKNLSDVIARCIRKGHIVESAAKKEQQKAWQITPTGEKYVEEEMSK